MPKADRSCTRLPDSHFPKGDPLAGRPCSLHPVPCDFVPDRIARRSPEHRQRIARALPRIPPVKPEHSMPVGR